MSCDPSGPGAYISSGTWSLLGLELQNPVTSEEARLAGFTNEGGVGGTYRFLTNIMGLWLIQECRRSWERRGRHWGYEELTALAAATPSPDVVIDVDDTSFFHPDDMVAALNDHFGETGQRHIDDPGSLIRAVFDSLALAYRSALQSAERLAGVRAETVHVVGGGSRNAFLCQLTADACGIPVVAGPAEATALGNALVQAMGDRRVRGLLEAREVVRESAVVQVFAPSGNTDWKERSERLAQMRGRRVKVQTTP
jgi:rhamnulokinase